MPEDTDPDAEFDPNANDLDGVSGAMLDEEKRMRAQSKKDDEQRQQKFAAERQKDIKGGKGAVDTKFKALEYLLSQSKLYSTIMLSQMQKQEQVDAAKDEKNARKAAKKVEDVDKAAVSEQRKSTRTATGKSEDAKMENGIDEVQDDQKNGNRRRSGRGRPAAKLKKETSKITDFMKKEDLEEAGKGASVQEALEEEASSIKPGEVGVQNLQSARQPDLVSGGTMRQYQLEGLEWLCSLYENGLNGILADEMGLGKTIQTISFLAFLRERGVNGPFLIAAPLSTTSNWVDEFRQWTPKIPVTLYHGTPAERASIRQKRFKNPGGPDFPVVCTSYEICMNDRKHLAHFGWKFIIIDEGHRIKNLNCRLIRELQSYQSANRLLITGTPLQNNLSELWSLLHFLMPDIFDKLESFESWFDFSALKEKNGYEQILSEERRSSLVTSLHAILKPFLLRRVKMDVEHNMPKKREYVLYAPLTQEQRELYEEILHGNSRAYLEEKAFESLSRPTSLAGTPEPTRGRAANLKRKRQSNNGTSTPNKNLKLSRASTPASVAASTTSTAGGRSTRAKRRQNYEEVSDSAYFKQMEEHPDDDSSINSSASEEDIEEVERAENLALAKKLIGQKKLQNPIMQLRLCCNSPHNFYDPFPNLDLSTEDDDDILESEESPANNRPDSPEKEIDYTPLLKASGKMLLLDRLLRALLDSPANHKILIFSQFRTQLSLLRLYLRHVLHVPSCLITGTTSQPSRRAQIAAFNDASSRHRVFLLSTRAGGQGINLASADTVILFDSDWNPQQDLQAQDRAHRIGQKRNVVVYRFASRGTVEEMLLEKAEGKRRLEKLVIQKGGVKGQPKKRGKGAVADEEEEDDPIAELRRMLGKQDGERLDFGGKDWREGSRGLLTDEEVRILIDRSDEAYVRAEKGEEGGRAGEVFKAVETKRGGNGLLESMETK
jgi:ATP-dependent DNA helicase